MKIDFNGENNNGGSTSDPDHPKAGASVEVDAGFDQDLDTPQDSGKVYMGAEQS